MYLNIFLNKLAQSLKKIATCDGKNSFCYACFDGKYSTEIPEENTVNKYETKINIQEGEG